MKKERKNRRHKIALTISRIAPYFIGTLWLVEAVISLIDKSDNWMLISIIGSIWILIGTVNSK